VRVTASERFALGGSSGDALLRRARRSGTAAASWPHGFGGVTDRPCIVQRARTRDWASMIE